MKLSSFQSAVATALMLTLVPGALTAGGRSPQEAARLRVAATLRHPGVVIGTAWHHDDSPISHALLRLRNVLTGQIVMAGQGDAAGRFTFSPLAPATYVVELVDDGGRVRALGQTFSMGSGETVATFIRLGTRIRWYSGFFTNAAASALATAASLGVTAVGDGPQPASARN